MNTEYMEALSREYNNSLKFANSNTENYIESSIDIVQRQLDIICACQQGLRANTNNAYSYLESLKKRSLFELSSLLPNKKVVTCREKMRTVPNFNTLINQEIELFIDLDYIKESGLNIDQIIDIETRALGVMGLIR